MQMNFNAIRLLRMVVLLTLTIFGFDHVNAQNFDQEYLNWKAKAYNFQQLYLTIYSDYIKFYNDTKREISKLEDKLFNEDNMLIESKIGRLLLIHLEW